MWPPEARLNGVVTRTAPRHKIPCSPDTGATIYRRTESIVFYRLLYSFFGLTKSFLRNEKSISFNTAIVGENNETPNAVVLENKRKSRRISIPEHTIERFKIQIRPKEVTYRRVFARIRF